MRDGDAKRLADYLIRKLPFCYVSESRLQDRKAAGFTAAEVLAAKLPDRGSIMAGEFGEILTMFFLRHERPEVTTPIYKWRYKEDRNKAARLSDVIIICRDADPSSDDYVICAEAKLKSTPGRFAPIAESIAGMEKDRKGRLARTLAWLREKAIEHETPERRAYIERFTEAGMPTYRKHFHAVAIIDSALLVTELSKAISLPAPGERFDVLVLGLDNLKSLYEHVYARAQECQE